MEYAAVLGLQMEQCGSVHDDRAATQASQGQQQGHEYSSGALPELAATPDSDGDDEVEEGAVAAREGSREDGEGQQEEEGAEEVSSSMATVSGVDSVLATSGGDSDDLSASGCGRVCSLLSGSRLWKSVGAALSAVASSTAAVCVITPCTRRRAAGAALHDRGGRAALLLADTAQHKRRDDTGRQHRRQFTNAHADTQRRCGGQGGQVGQGDIAVLRPSQLRCTSLTTPAPVVTGPPV